ncbi:Uncharacterized conserved protein, DUF2249 family [Brevibacterium sp. Mu109]|uniref:DUF2249 domain-containing protein n=1 Tax=Brevibacterium sp. Mu109 TaxID=1255669 RepID=UPI000C686C3F|nr:DUF2249 domain-containing protein [Brevibacterium sp. Mu109]MDN5895501.1 DUF2249 domain-containing protein [Nocardioides sp.]SMX86752.1 Uncharacterized conserved protein, DUF2249 family [Brevibacterium sp. Mu109]
MSSETTKDQAVEELDVRGMRKPDKHPTIFATYNALPTGGAFVLVNDHDPQHLREEFEADHAGSYDWEYLNREMRDWRIKITKLASTPLPRILVDTTTITAGTTAADVTGAAWKLEARERDLDSNIIALPPGGAIDAHTGPDLDVLIHVLAGSGQLTTELGTIDLTPGALVWMPRRSRRQFTASDQGLRYLTVHQRRQALMLDTSRAGAPQ